jgi:PAS domain S-box-containing protein
MKGTTQETPAIASKIPTSDELYRLLIKNLPQMAIAVFDRNLRFLSADGPFLHKLGFTSDQVVGRTIHEVFSPGAVTLLEPYYRAALKGEEMTFERELDGTFYRTQLVPVRDESNHVIAGMIVTQDVTEQKRAENALRQSEERYRTIFENSLDGVFLTKTDGSILMANAEACRMYGRTEQELIEAGRSPLMDMRDPRFKAGLEERDRTGKFRGELTALRRDGTPFPVEISTKVFALENGVGVTSMIVRDISEYKRVTDALRESEARFRQLAENLNQVFWLMSVDMKEGYYISPAYEKVWGRSIESFYERPASFLEAIHPDDRAPLLSKRRTMLNTGIRDIEYRVIRPDGTMCWIWSRAFPLLDENGNVYRMGGISEDITERKKVEEQSVELAVEKVRVEVLTNLFQNISHDLRTPLSIINTSAYLLDRTADPQKHLEHTQKIRGSVDRLERTLDEMMIMVRLDNGEPFDFCGVNVNELIQDMLGKLSTAIERKKLSIDYYLEPNIPLIYADAERLGLAILKIAENAIQYSPEGSFITIHTYQRNNLCVIEISDNGIGIAKADLPHIFERFYRADKARSIVTGGSGLGLSIAKSIVEGHEGLIEVESIEGKGSMFRFILPVTR